MKTSLLRKFPNDDLPESVIGGDKYFLHLANGKKILDFTGGWTAHCVLGLNDQGMKNAINSQLDKYAHVDGNIWSNPLLEKLADLIISKAPKGLDKVFIGGCNGSDAIEQAMKLSYHVHHDSGFKEKTKYIFREQSYSGATLQALSVTDMPVLNFFNAIKPSGYIKISEHNYLRCKLENETESEYVDRCVEELEQTILKNGPETIAAFCGETILGSLRGDVPPSKDYWKKVKVICDKYNIHLILDEIYCGMSRSGKVYCCSYDDVVPDFICIGKGAAGGYAPVSAVVTKSEFENIIANGSGRIQLGHTFSGYSLGVAAMYEAQKRIQTDEMLSHINKMGQLIRSTLHDQLSDHPFFVETHGRGLNSAFEYNCSNVHGFSLSLAQAMLNKFDILINAKWHRTTFTPAFIISEKHVNYVLECYIQLFKEVSKDWKGKIDSNIKVSRAMGGIKPGQ